MTDSHYIQTVECMSPRRHISTLLNEGRPLMSEFTHTVCPIATPSGGPCRAMAPIFDKAAKELEPRARFAKVNVDEEPAIAARYGIRGIPTLIAFDHGKVAKQHAGLVDINFLRGLAR